MNFVDFLFERIGGRHDPFLVGKNECDYGKLIDDVSRLANGITAKVGRGKEIVLLSDNGLFFITCYLAIMKSGNIAMLMDPKTGDDQFREIFKHAEPAANFIQTKYIDQYTELVQRSEKDIESLMSDVEVPFKTKTDELAAVVFTSGSTGAKKGVMITHGNLISNTSSIVEYLKLDSSDRVLVALPFHYCYGASLLHSHIRVGGSIVLFDANFLGAVPDFIDRYSCTGFSGVPSTYQILLAKTKFLKKEMPTLRYMTQAGGKLENIYIKQIVEAFPAKRFFVMYGATEATARMSYLPPDLITTKMGSIGKGIPNVTLKVVGVDEKEVSPGGVGEIMAKGDNIMVGYYHDPEGTAAVLRNGYYCTGDLAKVDEDGFIFIIGRSRDIIKSAGYRISPYEIENTICEIDGVAACAVVGIPDSIMGEAVVAIVQPKGGIATESLYGLIMTECKRKLSSYKVPRKIVIKEHLPTNSSNKVDKIALRQELADEGVSH